jgi:hypothetical protein
MLSGDAHCFSRKVFEDLSGPRNLPNCLGQSLPLLSCQAFPELWPSQQYFGTDLIEDIAAKLRGATRPRGEGASRRRDRGFHLRQVCATIFAHYIVRIGRIDVEGSVGRANPFTGDKIAVNHLHLIDCVRVKNRPPSAA